MYSVEKKSFIQETLNIACINSSNYINTNFIQLDTLLVTVKICKFFNHNFLGGGQHLDLAEGGGDRKQKNTHAHTDGYRKFQEKGQPLPSRPPCTDESNGKICLNIQFQGSILFF